MATYSVGYHVYSFAHNKSNATYHTNMHRSGPCQQCRRNKNDLRGHTGNKCLNTFKCDCGLGFNDEKPLKAHAIKEQKRRHFVPCLSCAKLFNNVVELRQHQEDTLHSRKPRTKNVPLFPSLKLYFDAFVKQEVDISVKERRSARITTQKVMNKLMSSVNEEADSQIYSNKPIIVGSVGSWTKVALPDEYDFNLPLNVDVKCIKTNGFIKYGFDQADCHCHSLPRPLHDKARWVSVSPHNEIPEYYAVIKHKNNDQHLKQFSVYGNVVPRFVQEDLFDRIKAELKHTSNDLGKQVNLQHNAHGPAITLTIRPDGQDLKHEISIDIAVCIKVNLNEIPGLMCRWPREDSIKVLGSAVTNDVVDAGVILVPKKDLFWYISYSRYAKKLMNIIDDVGECRRQCYKILKRDFMTWQSKSQTGLRGISSYIFKHHLFWMNEKMGNKDKSYWKDINIGKCYTDMLKSLSETLSEKVLFNYFSKCDNRDGENILADKDEEQLGEMISFLEERRMELLHITLA